MKGRLLINGIDAFVHYGVIVEHYGYKGVVQYPPLKKVTFNTWPEDDGVDPDLSEPQLNSREFDLVFIRINNTGYSDELVHILANEPYSEFNFIEIGIKLRLRLVSQSNNKIFGSLDKFTLNFAHDFPFENYTYAQPIDIGVKQIGYEIDEKPFADFGIFVLDGSDENIAKSPAVKQNLITNIDSKKGAIYHGKKVVFQQKDVVVKCLLNAPNKEVFWTNYMALLHDLIQPYERIFFTEKLNEEYPCFYKKSTVNKFDVLQSGRVWCEFSVTLTFYSFRVGDLYYLLAGEDGELILDEDGINYIDVKNY